MGRQSPKTKAKRRKATSAELEKLSKERKGALSHMGAALRQKFEFLEEKINTMQADNIRYYYELGKVVAEIKATPEKYAGDDGTPAMELIETALSTSTRLLRRCGSFVAAYSEDEMEELIASYNRETNFQLHWGHIPYLLTLDSKEKRKTMADTAIQNMWDPATLHEKIKKAEGRSGGHGRKNKLPPTLEGQVKQIRDLSRSWLAKNSEIWNGQENNVFTNIMNARERVISDDIVGYLKEIQQLMIDIADAARHNVGLAQRHMEYAEGVTQNRNREKIGSRNAGSRPARVLDLSTT